MVFVEMTRFDYEYINLITNMKCFTQESSNKRPWNFGRLSCIITIGYENQGNYLQGHQKRNADNEGIIKKVKND